MIRRRIPLSTLLILFNLLLTIASLFYDAPVLPSIPLWAWPFVVVCPLYPLLLALYWWKRWPWLAPFAILPAATYGIGALVYYPMLMHATYVNWQDIGTIFWVWLYAAQAWYFMRSAPLTTAPLILALLFLFASFSIQMITLSYGYLEYASLTPDMRLALFCIVCVGSLITLNSWLFIRYRSSVSA
jgi:hypothetical protein